MTQNNERKWFPFQANTSGIVNQAFCHHHSYDDSYCSNDTDDWTEPTTTDSFEQFGARKNFTKETIIAVALEADHRVMPLKFDSIVMARIDTSILRHNYYGNDVSRYFILDGERVQIDLIRNGKKVLTDFERRYLTPPLELSLKKSGDVCRVCPHRPNIKEIYGKCPAGSIIIRPKGDTDFSTYSTDIHVVDCSSINGSKIRTHGSCEFPCQVGFNSGKD